MRFLFIKDKEHIKCYKSLFIPDCILYVIMTQNTILKMDFTFAKQKNKRKISIE